MFYRALFRMSLLILVFNLAFLRIGLLNPVFYLALFSISLLILVFLKNLIKLSIKPVLSVNTQLNSHPERFKQFKLKHTTKVVKNERGE